jgi:hypothetical protein
LRLDWWREAGFINGAVVTIDGGEGIAGWE